MPLKFSKIYTLPLIKNYKSFNLIFFTLLKARDAACINSSYFIVVTFFSKMFDELVAETPTKMSAHAQSQGEMVGNLSPILQSQNSLFCYQTELKQTKNTVDRQSGGQ